MNTATMNTETKKAEAFASQGVPLKEYAKREGISLQSAYMRVWNERVTAVKDGRTWRILPERKANDGPIEHN
jgi:hypothetical protein